MTAVPLLVARRRPMVIVSHPVVVLGSIAMLCLAAAIGLLQTDPPGFRMSLDPSEEPMLRTGDPARDVYRDAVRTFGDDDLYVIAMQTGGVFQAGHLGVLREISDEVRRVDGVRRTSSLVDTTDYRYDAERDLVEVDKLIRDIPTDARSLERLRERATKHSLYEGSIVSADGRTGAINVSFQPMTDGEFVERRIDERMTGLLASSEGPDRRFFVTGRQHIKARAHRIMVDDLLLLIPLAVVVGAAIAWVVAGSLLGGVLPVVTSLVATLWVFGALAWQGRSLNLITIVMGPTLICVGSVYGVHVMSVHRRLLGQGKSRIEAAAGCLAQTCDPVLIAGATTCAGFAALSLSDTPAILELGVYCMFGIALASMLALTGLPALLGVIPPAALHRHRGLSAAVVTRALEAVAGLVAARPTHVLVAWSMLTIAAVACLPRIMVDSDYLTFFDPASRVRRDFAAISELLVGAVPLYVVVTGSREGAFRRPANLQAIERLQQQIDSLDGVSSTTSIVDLVRTVNRVLENDDPAAERIPDSRGKVADVLFFLPKNESRRFVNSNHSSVNIVVRTGRSGSAAILALERRLLETVAVAPLPNGLRAAVTGNAIIVNHGAERIARNQLSSFAAATAAILLIVSRSFRSLRIGLLAMVPNVVPMIMFFGVLGTGVAPLSLPTSLISCIALGIAVDDTAHFLVGYRRRREQGLSPEDSAVDCIRVLGHPIVTTSLMLTGGFLVLSLSGFATLRQFGHLTALTMLVCLCADLLLLPAILVRARA